MEAVSIAVPSLMGLCFSTPLLVTLLVVVFKGLSVGGEVRQSGLLAAIGAGILGLHHFYSNVVQPFLIQQLIRGESVQSAVEAGQAVIAFNLFSGAITRVVELIGWVLIALALHQAWRAAGGEEGG